RPDCARWSSCGRCRTARCRHLRRRPDRRGGRASGACTVTRAILLALCLSLASCGPAQGGRDPSAVVQASIALAFNAAVAALVWCDTREAIYLEALVNHLNQGGAV